MVKKFNRMYRVINNGNREGVRDIPSFTKAKLECVKMFMTTKSVITLSPTGDHYMVTVCPNDDVTTLFRIIKQADKK